MPGYLIDVNLPRYFSLWSGNEYEHVVNIDDELTDREIWRYAKEHDVTIVSKDADFSDIILLHDPPPRVIHIKYGNMKIRDFQQNISKVWNEVCLLSKDYKLVRVYRGRIECID